MHTENRAQVWAAVSRIEKTGCAFLHLGEYLFGQEGFMPWTVVKLLPQPLQVGTPLRVALVRDDKGWRVTVAQFGPQIVTAYEQYLNDLAAGNRPVEQKLLRKRQAPKLPQIVRRKRRMLSPEVVAVVRQSSSDTLLAAALRSALKQ